MQDEVQTTISGPETLRLPTEDLEVFDMLKQWLYQESVDPLPNVPKAPFSEWIGADRIGIDGIKIYWGASTRIPAEHNSTIKTPQICVTDREDYFRCCV
jgi:hypothetical protein